jgi:hypothetical protein
MAATGALMDVREPVEGLTRDEAAAALSGLLDRLRLRAAANGGQLRMTGVFAGLGPAPRWAPAAPRKPKWAAASADAGAARYLPYKDD